MRFPPKLSKREIEILPYLVGGLTRREIAELMSISEETVKIFTRKVSRKFGGQSLRDVLKDLTEYNMFFLQGEHRFYVPHVDLHVDVLEGRTDCRTSAKFEIVAISADVTSYVEAYTAQAIMKSVTVNGQSIQPRVDIEQRYIVEYDFETPIKPFEAKDLVVITEHELGENSDKKHSYGNAAYDPTGSMSVTVQFHSADPPTQISTFRNHGNKIFNNEFSFRTIESGVFQFHIDDPIFMSSYALSWVW
jgi:hypothetical protein